MSKESDLLRLRIAELEREMMEFRTSMARVLSTLYESVHMLESKQQAKDFRAYRDCIVNHFNMGEFKTMCFDLGVNFDDLDGDGLDDKAREFVLFMARIGRLDDISNYCEQLRPNAQFML